MRSARSQSFAGATALVTGASSGIGAEFARRLAGEVACLVLVARREDRLRSLAEEITAGAPGLSVYVESADLTDPTQLSQLFRKLQEREIVVDLLVNNAGLGDFGPFEEAPWQKLEQILRVNVLAATRIVYELVPGMVKKGRGWIINVGSIAGFQPIPFFAVYSASKAYLNSFSESLYWELLDRGIRVTVVCPGPVPTEFFDKAFRDPGGSAGSLAPSFMWSSPQEVVACALRAVRLGQPRVVPGRLTSLAAAIYGSIPLALWRVGLRWRVPRERLRFQVSSAARR
jgi:short-subunit dehydrogenase